MLEPIRSGFECRDRARLRIMVTINYGKRNNQKGGSRHERRVSTAVGDHGITVANDDASPFISTPVERPCKLFLSGIKRATTGRELKSFSKLAARPVSSRGWRNSLTRLHSAASIKGRLLSVRCKQSEVARNF